MRSSRGDQHGSSVVVIMVAVVIVAGVPTRCTILVVLVARHSCDTNYSLTTPPLLSQLLTSGTADELVREAERMHKALDRASRFVKQASCSSMGLDASRSVCAAGSGPGPGASGGPGGGAAAAMAAAGPSSLGVGATLEDEVETVDLQLQAQRLMNQLVSAEGECRRKSACRRTSRVQACDADTSTGGSGWQRWQRWRRWRCRHD